MMNYTWDVDSYDLLDIKENSVGKKIVVFGALIFATDEFKYAIVTERNKR